MLNFLSIFSWTNFHLYSFLSTCFYYMSPVNTTVHEDSSPSSSIPTAKKNVSELMFDILPPPSWTPLSHLQDTPSVSYSSLTCPAPLQHISLPLQSSYTFSKSSKTQSSWSPRSPPSALSKQKPFILGTEPCSSSQIFIPKDLCWIFRL